MPFAPETLESVHAKFNALVKDFDVHPAYKQFHTSPPNDGGAHVEHFAAMYAYVVTERGNEYVRRETDDPDELLYWLVSDVACEVAQQYELRRRVPGCDSRRLWFAKHVELLSNVCPNWGSRKRAEYDGVLATYPFNDRAPGV